MKITQLYTGPMLKMPGRNYKTYQIAQPVDTHWRPATCEEIECKAFLEGWTYSKSQLIEQDLLYLVTHAGKRWKEMSLADDAEKYLVFEPGQPCFQAASHRISLERPAFYFSGRGHYMEGYSMRSANQMDEDEWLESFAHHQDVIKHVAEQEME